MSPYLMRAPGEYLNVEERIAVKSFDHAVTCAGSFTADFAGLRYHASFIAVPLDRRVDDPVILLHGAVHETAIPFRYRVFLELFFQMIEHVLRERSDEKAADILIQAMHDARPLRILADPRALGESFSEPGDEGSRFFMFGRMREKARGLANDNERYLLMYEHWLGRRPRLSVSAAYHKIRPLDDIPGFQPVMNVDRFAIDRDLIRLKEFFYLIPRNVRMLCVQEYVEPLSFSSLIVIVHDISIEEILHKKQAKATLNEKSLAATWS